MFYFLLFGYFQKSDNSNTKANKLRVSESGGWCATVSGENSKEHKTDTKLVPVLADFFSGKQKRNCKLTHVKTDFISLF